MEPSASIYTTFTLRLYDFIVLCCSTRSTLLPFYEKHTKESSAHLEVGSGTGYYPSMAASAGALSKTCLITLCDLNPNTLMYSKNRLASAGYKGSIEMLEHNIFEPLAEDMRGKYDSIALYYLFHCLPQSFPQKAMAVFANVAPALAPNGVLYGATVLGKGVAHNWLGSWLMGQYNRKGIFGNTGDLEEGLRQALGEVFEECAVMVVGVVAMFKARKPRVLKK
ncbi:S-adenosyl-L-methionine dependent methyltransferase [Ganoderma leucocontextum]|nr:S-adenosyl-L-methionine dependent methyltransferase [Ganoderma leucocontextum]